MSRGVPPPIVARHWPDSRAPDLALIHGVTGLMYSTCLFCSKPLGSNEVLELFPVGRRIAFDGATGRLWVVCRSCERWNLSPLEERWEVIEDCERMFSDTRMRVSTENIGLARLREGLELVRIGKPMRPEFAAWRYGDQFGRRRRARIIRVGIGVAAVGALVAGAGYAGIAMGGGFWQFGAVYRRIVNGGLNRVVAHVPHEAERIRVKQTHLRHVKLLGADGDAWRISLPTGHKQSIVLTGDEAQRATALLLPHINRSGGNTVQISTAVDLLDLAGDPLQYVSGVARRNEAGGRLLGLPAPMRLALEMATHEEAERRALEGELKALEIAWREAEEVASISDSLLLPASVWDRLERLRSKL